MKTDALSDDADTIRKARRALRGIIKIPFMLRYHALEAIERILKDKTTPPELTLKAAALLMEMNRQNLKAANLLFQMEMRGLLGGEKERKCIAKQCRQLQATIEKEQEDHEQASIPRDTGRAARTVRAVC
jgi:hypothetical protein